METITQNTGIDTLLPLLDVVGLRCIWSRYFDMAEYKSTSFRYSDDALKYFVEGEGWFQPQGGPRIPFEAPSLFLVRKSGCYNWCAKGRIRAYVMHFDCSLSRSPELSLVDTLDLPSTWPARLVKDIGPILLETTEEFEHRRLGTQLLLDGYTRIILVHLLRDWAASGEPAGVSRGFLRLAPALNLVAHRLEDPPSVSEMAQAMGLTAGHFTQLFKETLHTSPRQYVNRLRMERARQLLLTTDMTIDQVARSLGFAYTHYFDRLFKREMATTPSVYRKKHRL